MYYLIIGFIFEFMPSLLVDNSIAPDILSMQILILIACLTVSDKETDD